MFFTMFLSKGILKFGKNVLNFLNFSQYYGTDLNFHKMYLKITKL